MGQGPYAVVQETAMEEEPEPEPENARKGRY